MVGCRPVNRRPDLQVIAWSALGLLMLVELLFSSRWWPPGANPLANPRSNGSTSPSSAPQLNALLGAGPAARVWMAPYFTYPEPGLLESTARRGVYDTFLVVPRSGSLAMNYGAAKLTPADTLFSLAAGQGLAAEWNLAAHLGYNRFALDLGAVTQPEVAAALCQTTPQCRLSHDGYALWVIPSAKTGQSQSVAQSRSLAQRLQRLQRREPLLPYRSAGPSWGPLVFNLWQWRAEAMEPPHRDGRARRLRLSAQPSPGKAWQIYRYPLDRYPKQLRDLLRLQHGDVQLVLPDGVTRLELCIGAGDQPCRPVRLGSAPGMQQRIPIAEMLQPGRVNRIALLKLEAREPVASPLRLDLSLPEAARELMATRQSP